MVLQTRLPARAPAAAAGWMLSAQLLFGFMASGARIGGHGLPWQEVCAARFLFGALVVYLAARVRGASLRVKAVRAAWVRSSLGTLSAAGTFYLYATPHLALGDAATLLATAPIFVAVLGVPLLGERVRPGIAAALACGFTGIVLVAQPSLTIAPTSIALGTGTAVVAALAFVSLRYVGQSESSEAVVFHFALVGTATMAVLSIPVWKAPDAAEGAALVVTGLAGGLAQIAMTRAYSLDVAARVSAFGYAGVVITRALAFPLFGEVPSGMQAVGSLFVIGSGVLLTRGTSPRRGGGPGAGPGPGPGGALAIPSLNPPEAP